AVSITIADMFDNFVVASKKTVSAAPLGETNMASLYDKAITATDKGLVIASALNNTALRTNLTAMRARAKFNKAVWGKVNPIGSVNTANPLVNDAGADADAAAALALMGAADYRYNVTPAVGGNDGFPIVGNDLNNRLELRAGDYSRDIALCRAASCDKFAVPTAAGNTVTGVFLQDPVTKIVDPVLDAAIKLCCIKGAANNNGDFVPLTLISAREMLLIRAEVALAQGNTAGFTSFINTLRGLNSTLTPYNGTSPAPIELLKHERFVNLFNEGRRLSDMYRFNIKSDRWASNGDAVRKPGCFFPIPAIERNSNPAASAPPLCGS
ncbi:MAG: RagB/SusD family nutrient uptake outer membrane protein, partial [Gemmatimonadaceae bacterium]